jgi:hypothetical protein
MDWCGSAQEKKGGCCEYGNELSGFVKCGILLTTWGVMLHGVELILRMHRSVPRRDPKSSWISAWWSKETNLPSHFSLLWMSSRHFQRQSVLRHWIKQVTCANDASKQLSYLYPP